MVRARPERQKGGNPHPGPLTLRGWTARFMVPTSAHRSRHIRCSALVRALPLLWKPLLLASIAKLRSNLVASQAGRRRSEPGRPLSISDAMVRSCECRLHKWSRHSCVWVVSDMCHATSAGHLSEVVQGLRVPDSQTDNRSQLRLMVVVDSTRRCGISGAQSCRYASAARFRGKPRLVRDLEIRGAQSPENPERFGGHNRRTGK